MCNYLLITKLCIAFKNWRCKKHGIPYIMIIILFAHPLSANSWTWSCTGHGRYWTKMTHCTTWETYSIYCLQEKHFSEEIHNTVTSKWGYKAYFSSVVSNKKELSNNTDRKKDTHLEKIVTDDEVDLMNLQLKMNNQAIRLVNLHSPNAEDRWPSFLYDRITETLDNTRIQDMILPGYWNLVLSAEQNSHNYKHINNPTCGEQVLEATNEFS